MSLFDLFRKKKEKNTIPITVSTNAVIARPQPQPVLSLHKDLKGLVWVADGTYKNYVPKAKSENNFETGGIIFSVSLMGQDEPSLIYTKEGISVPADESRVERPPYFPTYLSLSPEQKWIYLKFLENPYNTNIDVGYVFILYYGLERHLLEGDVESAFRVILKLRDVHQNKSFQSYSANALILTSMLRQRGDLAIEFIQSLDKDHELAFSDNLFLICYFSFNIPLLPKDIMRMAKTFEFTNNNYIKNQPKIFEECLSTAIIKKTGLEFVEINNYATKSELRKIRMKDVSIFANTSITDKAFSIPILSEVFKLKKEINNFLGLAHEEVKKDW